MARFLPLSVTRLEYHVRGPYGSAGEDVDMGGASSALWPDAELIEPSCELGSLPVCVCVGGCCRYGMNESTACSAAAGDTLAHWHLVSRSGRNAGRVANPVTEAVFVAHGEVTLELARSLGLARAVCLLFSSTSCERALLGVGSMVLAWV